MEQAQEHEGTWWDHWLAWILERSGNERNAPKKVGNKAHPPLADAPGTYVLEDA